MSADLVVRGATIVDGSGSAPFTGDVAVSDGLVTEVGTVSTDVSGTSVIIGAVAPIPIITPVRAKACDQLSEQLRSFLFGDDLAVIPETAGSAPAAAGSTGQH